MDEIDRNLARIRKALLLSPDEPNETHTRAELEMARQVAAAEADALSHHHAVNENHSSASQIEFGPSAARVGRESKPRGASNRDGASNTATTREEETASPLGGVDGHMMDAVAQDSAAAATNLDPEVPDNQFETTRRQSLWSRLKALVGLSA